MSTVERKEYQETKVMRTVSPVRNFRSSSQNLAEFDHNLDYMLEDLQNSVSRPGSSLGNITSSRNTTLDTTRSNSLQRYTKSNQPVEYSSDDAYNYTKKAQQCRLQAVDVADKLNNLTGRLVNSLSRNACHQTPDGRKHVSGYKKESYSYKTSGGDKVRAQNSINQLDSLLDDLQQVKNSSFQENSYNNIGGDPDFQVSRRNVQRELHYGDTPRSSSRTRTLERNERESSLTKEYSSENTYGDIRQIRSTSPAPSSRTSTLSKQTKVTNLHSYPVEVVQTSTPDINPEILAHLDPNLHPPGNTKVTTTIKTYTYEIPGSGPYPTTVDTTIDSEKYVYSPNQSQTTPSKSFTYKKIDNQNIQDSWENRIYKDTDNKTITTTYQAPPYQKPNPPAGAPYSTVIKETVTTRNYQPEIIPSNNQTYVYNETVTTKNFNNQQPQPPRAETPRQNTYLVEEKRNTVTNKNINQSPVPDRKYISSSDSSFVKEYHDTRNLPKPYVNGYAPTDVRTAVYKYESQTTNNHNKSTGGDIETFEPINAPYKPKEPVNIQYKYKSESTTTNNYKAGYPPRNDTQVLLPKPFPTDTHPDGPPKKLDELMANIGHEPPNSPYNASFTAHEHELVHKKKAESLKQQQADIDDEMQKKEAVPRSKNVSGPPVYYPPGHEMFAKKEEGGGWRAEGAYGRESGKYQYEAESKSKTKTRSGAAIVPVCLPLCCGLPCAII